MRYARLAAAAGLIGLAGCATTSVHSPGGTQSPATSATASSAASPAPSTAAPAPTVTPTVTPTGTPSASPGGPAQVCLQAGTYLTAVRTAEHIGYDRVAFQFSGNLPSFTVEQVRAVYSDPRGTPVALAGQSYLRVVFHGASAVCPQPLHQTYTGPAALTPYYPELQTVSAAGDFEAVLSFGVGLAGQGGYRAFTLANPNRVVIDVTHVALGEFPGVWDITSWAQYWATQYAWLNGHQPWLSVPSLVVQAWAAGYGSGAVVRQVSANTFQVSLPDGKTRMVTGVRPVSVPGPWVITEIT